MGRSDTDLRLASAGLLALAICAAAAKESLAVDPAPADPPASTILSTDPAPAFPPESTDPVPASPPSSVPPPSLASSDPAPASPPVTASVPMTENSDPAPASPPESTASDPAPALPPMGSGPRLLEEKSHSGGSSASVADPLPEVPPVVAAPWNAAPSNAARQQSSPNATPFLGVGFRNPQRPIVTTLYGGSTASILGISLGDEVVSVNGKPVKGIESLRAILAQLAVGAPVKVVVARGNTTMMLGPLPISRREEH